jgi:hypothetical protein
MVAETFGPTLARLMASFDAEREARRAAGVPDPVPLIEEQLAPAESQPKDHDDANEPFHYDEEFDPFTDEIVWRGSKCTVRLDRESGEAIWRGPAGEYRSLAGGNVALKGKKQPAHRRRGPQPGTINRHGAADRALFPEIERLAKEKGSITAATRQLAEAGRVAGTGVPKSLAARLATVYRSYLTEPAAADVGG